MQLCIQVKLVGQLDYWLIDGSRLQFQWSSDIIIFLWSLEVHNLSQNVHVGSGMPIRLSVAG